MPPRARNQILLYLNRTSKILTRSVLGLIVIVVAASGLPLATGVNTALGFNEATGTAANDQSGNNHNGSLVNGPAWASGKYGPGISFDGVNDYVNIPDHSDYTLIPGQNYTWSAWVNSTTFNEWGTVWSQTIDVDNYFYFYVHSTTDEEAGPVTNGVSVYWVNGTDKLVLHSTSNVFTAGTWGHVTVTYDGSQPQNNRFAIYVNGTDVTDRTDIESIGTISTINPTNIRIGSNEPFGDFLNASVDEVRYYTRLLSTSEIAADMNTPIDNTAPTVNITSPASGASVSGTINVAADAADNVGVIGVQFQLDGVNFGTEDQAPPYSVSWNTTSIPDGQYILTARARDAAGNLTTSAGVTVTVHNSADTQAPSVSLTAPSAGIINGTVSVNASASDNVGVAGVQFLLNGANLGAEDVAAPYSFSWNTATGPDGHYVLTARARDLDGNTTTSLSVNVTVYNTADVQAPTISLSSPVSGNVAGVVDINAIANDNIAIAGVQFLLNGSNLGAEITDAPYSYSWNTTALPDGNYILSARARDLAGNVATAANVMVNVKNDAQPPSVTLTAPAAGTVAGTVSVTANASDNVSVAGVQFLLNGSNLGSEDVTPPYSLSWNTATIGNGNYTLTARARDASGNIQLSSPVVVNVQNVPPDTEYPSVNITSPSAGNINGTITVSANATDNVGVVGVQFFLNGSEFGAEDLTAPFSFSWNTYSVANGSYTLTATARDAAGNVRTSNAITINVNNVPDTEIPTVSITSPSTGDVIGTVNVRANATDNIGVAGVQFILDGNNLGAEDLVAPYAIAWNTTTTTAGNHILSARARDVAGNLSLVSYVNVNVIINSPPVISAVAVNTITANSAIITWTTNVPSSSLVNYDVSTAYTISSLTDQGLTTSHSVTLLGLAPATLYHYQVASADTNGTRLSADNTFTTAGLATSLGNLNQHTVFAYPSNKIVPWTWNPANGYDTVIYLAWNYLLNSVPNDPSTGKPAYYSRSYLDPNSQAVINWPHNPAGLYGMLTESALKYYNYSANGNVMQLATNVALWHLDHGMTLLTDNWANVPYASGDVGSLTYDGADVGNANGQGDGDGYIEPDKIGELANAWLQLYKYNGNTRFRDAAIQAANVLTSKIRTGTVSQSPWPFRVNAHNGAVREDYCSNIIGPISLLDNLIANGLGDTASYRNARTIAWNWMMNFPMVNNAWAQYFEDVPIQSSFNSNLNQYNAMMVARYLLEHPEFDPNWQTHARGLITWVENTFSQSNFGATTIREQQQFLYPMGSHTSRYASVNALLYEKTGDLVAKEKAYRAFNWATYMCRTNGVVIDGPDVNNQWFTDGYGDYVRHFMTGLAAVPEWVPSNQTHLLRSTSVVKDINYGINAVNYTTYDSNAVEVIHLNFNPGMVTAGNQVLQRRSDLSQPGWTLDIATKTLRVYHANSGIISISSGGPIPICPGETTYFTVPSPGAGYTYQWQVDSIGNGYTDISNSAVYSGVNTDTLWLNNTNTSYYGYRYRCVVSKNGVPLIGPSYELRFVVKWQGGTTNDWEDASNWSCNYVPDGKTDVIINGSPTNPVIHNNVTVHSVTLSSGVVLTIGPNLLFNITGK